MCRAATYSGEAAQTLTSPTSKWGLDREVWAALHRVRTGPEYPEGNLKELAWDSNPDCGIAIPWKALTWDTAPHSSTLAWKIPWTEEPGRLQSMGSLRVGHDWATSLSLFTCMHWRRKWQPTPLFLPGESQGCGAWWAAVYGAPQSRTRLKQLSSNSNSS